MRFPHGGFAFDLPDDWSDESTLLFLGPERAAISVRFFRDAREPKEILAGQSQELTRVDPGFRRLEEGAFRAPLGSGWAVLQRLAIDGKTVRQRVVLVAVGPMRVMATGTAPDEAYDRVRPKLDAILGSMGFA